MAYNFIRLFLIIPRLELDAIFFSISDTGSLLTFDNCTIIERLWQTSQLAVFY